MNFGEALHNMMLGKIVTEGCYEYRICRLFQCRPIGNSEWSLLEEMSPEELLFEDWQIVNKDE